MDARAQARVGQFSGYTPLIHADRLGAELGIANLYLKDDSSQRPSFSYKDRVVSMSIARLLEKGKTEIGCVSTGNVGTATASLAAKAGVDAYVFYPNRLEPTKARAAWRWAPRSARSRATTTKPTAAAAKSPKRAAWSSPTSRCGPSTPRARRPRHSRSSSSSTGTRPSTSSSPAAGGTLSSRMHKGLNELQHLGPRRDRRHSDPHRPAERLQPDRQRDPLRGGRGRPRDAGDGRALAGDRRPRRRLPGDRRRPQTRRHGRLRLRPEIFAGIDLLAATEGLLTEPAGGTTIAVLEKLAAAGRFGPDETVVVMITGNGMKTLDEHPPKPWPAKVDCERDAMISALDELKGSEKLMDAARRQLQP